MAQHLDIIEYIPQRPPIVMIESLNQVFENGVETALTIQDENIFVSEGRFTSLGIIENIAQTAACSAGYYFKVNGEDVKLGFIGAVKNLEILDWPKVGEKITTQIRQVQEVANIKIVEGKVFLAGQVIASTEMKIFIVDEE